MSRATMPPDDRTVSNHLVIEPPVDLGTRVRVIGTGLIDDEAVSKAERDLDRLSAQFDAWMDQELSRLTAARDRARREGLAGEAGEALFTAAHDIRGEAATLGFPVAGGIAATLCDLIVVKSLARLPFRLVDTYVDAICAAVGHARGASAGALSPTTADPAG